MYGFRPQLDFSIAEGCQLHALLGLCDFTLCLSGMRQLNFVMILAASVSA
jgi:hypothetical protein